MPRDYCYCCDRIVPTFRTNERRFPMGCANTYFQPYADWWLGRTPIKLRPVTRLVIAIIGIFPEGASPSVSMPPTDKFIGTMGVTQNEYDYQLAGTLLDETGTQKALQISWNNSVTANGYINIDNNTVKVLECGNGINPFFMNDQTVTPNSLHIVCSDWTNTYNIILERWYIWQPPDPIRAGLFVVPAPETFEM
jgi:hypothetical protein